ncbi:hypothetical protein FGE12_27015 [Aggregicoccus sp. 17bor-14]|uniref:hypothetical protein n=1 Tax=Myxococcaceae TaxID=31 RepID=UPI00129C972E|nr:MULTISPECIES: hypothetical protein [Myxococcaceae]MBF5046095.1 hypothetical protein [Simulacricoccus sp. 17bor-14]MRI91824.1 hypothetical protein [Aggregicoccus sp. 17bor-14]
MNLKPGILTLLVGTVLFGAGAALADDHGASRGGDRDEGRREWRDRRDDRRDDRRGPGAVINVRVGGGVVYHRPPEPAPRPDGRYELRTTQRWVSGYEERVWVPEVCTTEQHHHMRRTTCRDGYYDTRYVDGHYEPAEEWVWVPYPPRPYGRPGITVTARF